MTTAADQDRLFAQLAFIIEIDKLKRILRRNNLMDGSRRENDAEHSWHLAAMALVLRDYAPAGIDVCRVVTMLLIHDIVEIDAGDAFIYDPDPAAAELQAEREQAAAARIFGLLPDDQAGRLQELWAEFEARKTPDARFAKAIDRFAPMLANSRTDGGTWVTYKLSAAQVSEKIAIIEDGAPALAAYARDLVETAVARGHLRP